MIAVSCASDFLAVQDSILVGVRLRRVGYINAVVARIINTIPITVQPNRIWKAVKPRFAGLLGGNDIYAL